MAWTLFIAALMISSLPTYSWSSIRIRSGWRLFALGGRGLLGAALLARRGSRCCASRRSTSRCCRSLSRPTQRVKRRRAGRGCARIGWRRASRARVGRTGSPSDIPGATGAFATQGGGDLRADFRAKIVATDDGDEPQGGQEGRVAERCEHERSSLVWRHNRVGLALFRFGLSRSCWDGQCSSFVLIRQEAICGACLSP